MVKSAMTNKMFHKKTLLVCLFMLLPFPCYSGVIFEENFDSQADWNVKNNYTSECPGKCTSAPNNWTNYRTVPGNSSLPNPTGSIQRLPGNLPDHTTGSGKAFIVYNQAVKGANWPGDSILVKVFPRDYSELYVRFWIRTQSNWQSVASAQSKIFRILHWDRIGNIFQWKTYSSPIYFWDWGTTGSNAASYISAYRCDPQVSNYYCTNSGTSQYQKNDIFHSWGNVKPTNVYADTHWHRYDFHVKVNNIGNNNGVLEWWYDGALQESHKDVQWKAPTGSSADIGWNTFAIGGNSNNTFASRSEQWYAVDDIVVSTSPIPIDYVIFQH